MTHFRTCIKKPIETLDPVDVSGSYYFQNTYPLRYMVPPAKASNSSVKTNGKPQDPAEVSTYLLFLYL